MIPRNASKAWAPRSSAAAAAFTGPKEVAAGDYRIRARRFVVATGSTPSVPPLPGLDKLPYFTNETIFDLTKQPRHLLVIGGGPIGCELAQAFRRLGADVTVVEMARLLPKDDPEAAAVVRDRLQAEGVRLLEDTKVMHAVGAEGAITLALDGKNGPQIVTGSHLLVAAGRRANFAGLELEKAGIAATPQGITVDAGLRTSNRRVYAIGDVIGGLQFTHAAGYHAGIVIRRALFRLPAKMKPGAIPWVTYTDPELAQAGETEASARQKGLDITVTISPFARNDRAQTERDSDGFVKVISTKNGRILGATIVGAQAGELIQVWCLAIAQGLKLSAMAGVVVPYPTRGEVRQAGRRRFLRPEAVQRARPPPDQASCACSDSAHGDGREQTTASPDARPAAKPVGPAAGADDLLHHAQRDPDLRAVGRTLPRDLSGRAHPGRPSGDPGADGHARQHGERGSGEGAAVPGRRLCHRAEAARRLKADAGRGTAAARSTPATTCANAVSSC